LGIPLSYKRSGRKKFMSHDQQSLEKKCFVNAISNLFQISRKEIVPFGKAKVEVRATFIFTRKCIMNDVDNLTKCILDCFQIGNIYHDDRQVMKITVEKKTGTQAMTDFMYHFMMT
jgi:Holliday junction resolvase RusA-like endonuclease